MAKCFDAHACQVALSDTIAWNKKNPLCVFWLKKTQIIGLFWQLWSWCIYCFRGRPLTMLEWLFFCFCSVFLQVGWNSWSWLDEPFFISIWVENHNPISLSDTVSRRSIFFNFWMVEPKHIFGWALCFTLANTRKLSRYLQGIFLLWLAMMPCKRTRHEST